MPMEKFNEKRIEVDACQWTGSNLADFPGAEVGVDNSLNFPMGSPNQGVMSISLNWWVIKDSDGYIAQMPDEMFRDRYEGVPEVNP